jgi:hypothetical protein
MIKLLGCFHGALISLDSFSPTCILVTMEMPTKRNKIKERSDGEDNTSRILYFFFIFFKKKKHYEIVSNALMLGR